jgi:hypothetical protein
MRKRGTALKLAADAPSASSAPAEPGNRPLPPFTPVPRQYRRNGWTPERQAAFIAALADTGCVAKAARRVGMARTRCYALRRGPAAESFRAAWDAAIEAWRRRERKRDKALYRSFAARLGFPVQDTVTPVTPPSLFAEPSGPERRCVPLPD